jgi:hypothetical protein
MRFDWSPWGGAIEGGGQGGGGLPTFDADAALYFAAVVTAGGAALTPGYKVAVNNFVLAEKTSVGGIVPWNLTDDYWLLWGENATQALVSLKQLRTATIGGGAPVHTPGRDYTFAGSPDFINTGFVPSTHGINLTGSNQRLAVYERTNVGTSTDTMGAFTSGTVALRIQARSGTTLKGSLDCSLTSFTLGVSDSRGLKSVSRASGATTTMIAYDRGVRLTDATGLTVGSTLTANALYMGADNNAGSAATFRACSLGFACVGAPLGSDAAELAQYNNVQALATARGANV